LTSDRRRLLIALVATVALLAPLAYFWQASLLPDSYSVMDMGYADYGGGPETMTQHDLMGRSVASLVADPQQPADVQVTLTTRKQRFRLESGEQVDGYTVNGTSPGPVIRAVQGQLVEVKLVNESVPDGVTLHWHGVDVPNAADGVAGVTQDAVAIGKSFTYRFVADQAGTYWYHSHQVSHAQVQGGLLGALVVTPPKADPDIRDQLAMLHVYDGRPTINGSTGDVPVDAAAGETVRVRVVNTDNGATSVWTAGSPYRVMAVDGYDLNEPTPVSDQAVRLTAGGRIDLQVTAPARVEVGGSSALIIGAGARAQPQPTELVDLLTYGTPTPLDFDPSSADRKFTYSVGRRPGYLNGRPCIRWSINGNLITDCHI
jgi:FtsP/CotA-like multicopper oxidase with cupredoxin domain